MKVTLNKKSFFLRLRRQKRHRVFHKTVGFEWPQIELKSSILKL